MIGLNPQLVFLHLNTFDLVEHQSKEWLAINRSGSNALHLVFVVNQSIRHKQCPPDLDDGSLRLPWPTRLRGIPFGHLVFSLSRIIQGSICG